MHPTLQPSWEKLLTELQIIEPFFGLEEMVFPSGNSDATLHLKWHYPPLQGGVESRSTSDPTNDCMHFAATKLGLTKANIDEVFMTETISCRYHRQNLMDKKPYTFENREFLTCLKSFSEETRRLGRVVLLLGYENFRELVPHPDFPKATALTFWPERRIFGQQFYGFFMKDPKNNFCRLVLLA